MNAFRLTLRNSFKNAFQSVAQLFGLIILITILSLIVSLITAIYSGVISNFDTLVARSNLRTLVVDMTTDTRVKTGSDPSAGDDVPTNNVEAQQNYLYKLNQKYSIENPDWAFSWSRTEERNFSGLKNGDYDLRVKTVAKTTPNTSKNKVDALVIGTGHNIQSPKQTVIDATFATKNNVNIGDILRYQPDGLGTQLQVLSSKNTQTSPADFERLNKIKNLDDPDDIYNQFYSTYHWFQVVGFGESADFVSPTMDAKSPLANKKTELIAYVEPTNFGLIKNNDEYGFTRFDESRMVLAVSSSADRDGYYSLRLNADKSGFGSGLDLNHIANQFNIDLNELMDRNNLTSPKLIYGVNDSDYKFYGRVWNIVTVINMYNIIAGLLLILVLGVVLFAIGLVTKKQVEKTRSQIGLMKALGYSKRLMIFNYSVLPFITSVIGSVIGFGLAQAIQIPIINDLFGAYFNLDFPIWTFDPIGFVLVIFVTWLIISGIAFLIAWLIMRDSALELINGNIDPKISKLGMFIKKISINQTVMGKLRTALLATSLGKMSAVSLVVFLATILMTAGFSAPKLLDDNQEMSYTGIKYQQLVEYDNPIYNNPYSFMQTYDPSNLNNTYQFAPGLNEYGKITALPVVQDQKAETYSYDMNQIIDQILSQQISPEYYGMEISTESEIPGAVNVMLSNMKMLNSQAVTLNNHFLRMIADYAQLDPWGWNILSNQWPAYIDLIRQINLNQTSFDQGKITYDNLIVDDFYLMQNFYRTYIVSIGLTVTKDYYDELDIDNDPRHEAYLNHDYAAQIGFFNNNESGRKKAFESYKGEQLNGTSPSWGNTLVTDLNFDDQIRISDGKGVLPINSLYRENVGQQENDIYLSMNPEDILNDPSQGIEALKSYLADYFFWYGTYISQRSGAALIQAAYSRPPYFVQQMFKDAYNKNTREDRYSLAFGLAPFNPRLEQLGLKLDVNPNNNPDLNFKIYGIQNNKKYLDLRDQSGTDLIRSLYRSDEINPLVINESLAFKLNLKVGDSVNLDVLYDELQNNGFAYSTKDWQAKNVRDSDRDPGFMSRNDMNMFETEVNNPDPNNPNKSYKISTNQMDTTNAPSEYYKAVLRGEISNVKKTKPITFKVIGVHHGYGTVQGWMRNDNVEQILNYQAAKEYLWTNFFVTQFGDEFNNSKYSLRDLYFPHSLADLDYQSFLDNYVNNENSPDNAAAIQINKLFNNAYPIFNYKFSLSDDVADLKTGVPTFHAYGIYSPIALNGGISEGISYDGMGASAIKDLIPIKISKDILSQLSGIIKSVLIMLIVMLIVITFIIILLTTSLIINDNIRFISTMKVLGYTNQKISLVILGMYAIVILIMFSIGYIAGWFIFAAVIKQVGMLTTFVLPLSYPIWLVFAVGVGIFGIYAVNFGLGYRNVAKNNAVHVLQNSEI